MRAVALALIALVLAAALAGCRSAPLGQASPSAVRGRVDGVSRLSAEARVQVYRLDDEGLPTPDPFENVTLERDGRFATRVLSPGRYRLVYRHPDGPPSELTVRVPSEQPAVLRPLVQAGLVQLRVRAAGNDALRCRLTEEEPVDGIRDIREFRAPAEAPVFVRGLRPGRWFLDLPDTGQTTEVDVPAGDGLRDLVVDPPPIEAGGAFHGEIRRVDGLAGAWLVVTARPLTASGETAARWGRYATSDRSGCYRVVGIPPGPALVRVECREVPIRILPAGQVAAIPPSGELLLGFVVEP